MEENKTIFKMEVLPGREISSVMIEAYNKLKDYQYEYDYITFNFNGVEVIISHTTNLTLLLRDFNNAMKLDWKKIGPYSELTISQEIQLALDKKLEERKQKEIERINNSEENKSLTLQDKIENTFKYWLLFYFNDREYYRVRDSIHLIECKQIMPNEFHFEILLSYPGMFIGKAGEDFNKIEKFMFEILKEQFGEENKFEIKLKEFNPFKLKEFNYEF